VIAMVDQLVATGKLSAGNANALTSQLENAKKQLERGKTAAASDILETLLVDLNGLVNDGRLSAADAEPLRVLITRVIESISP